MNNKNNSIGTESTFDGSSDQGIDYLKHYYRKMFASHPVLLTFFRETDETSAGKHSQPAAWANVLYTEAEAAIQNLEKSILADVLNNITVSRSIELERTVFNLMALDAIIREDAAFFCESKTVSGENISLAQFEAIVTFFKTYVKDVTVLKTAIVLGDVGKVVSVRDFLTQKFNLKSQDPDYFKAEFLALPYQTLQAIFPSIHALTESQYHALQNSEIDFHWGHFLHAESTHQALREPKEAMLHNEESVYMSFMVQILDVMGAHAHNEGKLLFDKAIYEAYCLDVLTNVQKLKSHTTEAVYLSYLNVRLKRVGFDTTLEACEGKDYFFARLICMFRIYEKSTAEDFY